MNPRFTVSIDLGNAAMLTAEHVAEALRTVAETLDGHPAEQQFADADAYDRQGTIRDENGNRVGTWKVSK